MGRSRERMSDAEKASMDDKRVQVSGKMTAKERHTHRKGNASGPDGGWGVYYALKVQHIKHAEGT